MSRIDNALDNRPIEYFFSILKQEYLRKIPVKERTIEKIKNELDYIKFHYNNIRFQGNLQNKTPREYVV